MKEEDIKQILIDNKLLILDEAMEGNKLAEFMLGWMYDNEIGFPKNKKEALKYYLRAAEKGNTDAMVNIGIYYEDESRLNYNSSIDKIKAFKYYEEGAKLLKNARAIGNLGVCYEKGIGCAQDKKKAFEFYSKADGTC